MKASEKRFPKNGTIRARSVWKIAGKKIAGMTMKQKINSKTMKEINTRNVLSTIRKKGQVSRKELARQTELTTGTITNLTGALMSLGYLVEVGCGESEGGRKPILLELSANAGYAVGLELEVSNLTCVVSDFKADVLVSKRQSVHLEDGKNAVIDQMTALVEKTVQEAGIDRKKILGLGLAVPGPCDYEKGIMINPPNFPQWIDVPIRSILSERLQMPVYTSKETSCAALSEFWFSDAAGTKRILGIKVGDVGIGGALVLNGDIFQEKEGESMDIGHTIVQLDGFPCTCGTKGCLEAHAAGIAAVRYAQEMIAAGEKSILPQRFAYQDVVSGVKKQDAVCVEAVKKCAFYISVALGNTLSLLSPQRICLGGNFVHDCPLLYQKIIEYLERREYPASAKKAQKAKFAFGNLSGAMGGLALVFDAFSKTSV